MAVLYRSGGYSPARLAELYGATLPTVHEALLSAGVEVSADPSPSSPDPIEVTMERLYDLPLSIDRVGWLCGYAYGKTRKILLGAGVKLRKRGIPLAQETDIPRLVRLYKYKGDVAAAAKACGVSYRFAYDRLRDAGALRPRIQFVRPSKPLSESAVVNLYRQGFNKEAIRQLTGRSSGFVHRALAQAGLPARVKPDALGVDIDTLTQVYQIVASRAVTAEVLHLSCDAVRARLWEAGQDVLSAPDPEVAPLRIEGHSAWQPVHQNILTRAEAGQSRTSIARALRLPPAEVAEVLRLYQHRDRVTAEVLYRYGQGETPGVIAIRMGLRLDRVSGVLAEHSAKRSPQQFRR
ncbi:hypothetical protein AB0C52_33205 [Streptomyces sp. NPDC048717]|uniref:hypothetical protein n=1 Tax=Streptomyces sp. NPDC048717 TaxID=3154928 RepID=UPI0034259148